MTVEDEIIHWWKDDQGELHRNVLRLETEEPAVQNGFPRDGIVLFKLMNGTGTQSIKLSPDEALRISAQLVTLAKELLNKKRVLWKLNEE